jgi:hypothetical protein
MIFSGDGHGFFRKLKKAALKASVCSHIFPPYFPAPLFGLNE